MTDAPRKRLVRRRIRKAWSCRGEIYGWLRAHHSQIKKLKVGQEKPWAELLADLTEDFAGTETVHVVTLKNVTNIWKRVCRDVESEPPAVNRFKNYPSRISKDWRPSGFREQVSSPGTAVVPVTPSEVSFRASLGLPPKTEKVIRTVLAEGEVLSDEEVDAEMDRMTAKLNGRKAG